MNIEPQPPGDAVFSAEAALLQQCFADDAGDRHERLERLCTEHPSSAASLRRLYARLLEFGLVDEPTARPLPPPTRLGPYRLLSVLGRGGMGVVHLAEHEVLGRRVALKVLHHTLARTPKARERFRREAIAAARLEHEGICGVHEVGVADDVPFLAMRLVPGESLAHWIDRARGSGSPGVLLPGRAGDDPDAGLAAIVTYVERAALALHAAHEAGLVHRDVKPGNLMVTPQGAPVVLDFGLAQREDGDDATLTRTGDQLGTPVYMAPEQVMGLGVDRTTDVHALGVVLYEMLTLQPPYQGVRRASLFEAIRGEDPPDPRSANPAIGRDLWTVLQTALAKEPARRYRTAAAFAEDLRRVRAHEPILARPPGLPVRLQRFVQRNPVVATLIATMVVVSVVMAWLWQQRGDALAQRTAALGEKDRALEQARAIELALRANDGREGPVPSLQQAIEGYEMHANVDTLSALYAATLRCTEEARCRNEALLGGIHWDQIHFAPDGQSLLTPGWNGTTSLWNLRGERIAALQHEQMVNTAVFSGDGAQILTASMDGSAAVWTREGALVFRLHHGPPAKLHEADWLHEQSHCVLFADWSPDGSRIATGCSDRTVRFWDARTGAPIGEPIRGHEGPPMVHAWSPDGQLLATAECDAQFDSGLASARVLVHRAGAGHERVFTLVHPRPVFDVRFVAGGKSILTACGDGFVRLFHLPDATGDVTLAGPDVSIELGGRVLRAEVSADGQRILACATNGVVGLWHLDGSMLRHRTFDNGTWVRFGPGDRIVGFHMYHVLQLDGDLREQRVHVGHSHTCTGLVMSPDGSHLASMSRDETARIWSVVDPELPRWHEHGARVAGLVELPEGTIASTSNDGRLRVWARDGGLVRSFEGEPCQQMGLAVDASGRRFAMPARDGVARIVDATTATWSRLEMPGPLGAGGTLEWLPDGRLAIGAGIGSELWVYSADGSKEVWPKPTIGVFKDLVVAPRRGVILGAGWNSRITVWRLPGGQVQEFPTDQESYHLSLAISPDETLFAAGGGDHRIRLLQLADDGTLTPVPESPLRGHDSSVMSVAWSPDGHWFASGAADGSVRLWDTRKWQTVAVLRGHDRGGSPNPINAVLFTRDGRRLLTAGDDGAIQSWPVDTDELLEIARRKVARVQLGTPTRRR